MRIDSMDAAFKPNISVTSAQIKEEKAVNSERFKNQGNGSFTEEKISDAFLQKAIDKANSTFETMNRSLRFKIHERTNEVIVKVIDSETEEVIKEIPPEKLLDMFANMLELAGLLIDERG